MIVIVAAGRADSQNQFFKPKAQRSELSDHTFLLEGIQIEDLTNPGLLPCLVSQLTLLTELTI